METKTYFRAKKHMTKYCRINCSDCKLGIMHNNKHVNCHVLEFDYPEVAEELMQEYIDKTFPNGYINCIQTKQIEDVAKCNKFESCTECMEN